MILEERLDEIEVLPVEVYMGRFTRRYDTEPVFQRIVHQYLHLSEWEEWKLWLGALFLPTWYEDKTQEMINEYARKTYSGMVTAQQTRKALLDLIKEEEKLLEEQKILQVDEVRNTRLKDEAKKSLDFAGLAAYEVSEEYAKYMHEEQERVRTKKARVQKRTNARDRVKTELRKHIKRSELVKVDSKGQITFNEEKMMQILEDKFLKDIVKGINASSNSGFMSKVRSRFREVITHWGDAEDPGEMIEADWVESAILSRTHGYAVPTYPFIITPKYGAAYDSIMGRTTIDTAITLDVSGSMDGVRYETAKKATLATHALMRQLNKDNKTYLSIYSTSVLELTTKELMQRRQDGGGTETDKALNWLYNTLKDGGPAIAYLITDGAPNSVPASVSAAKRFRDLEHVMLRIFLIDGNANTIDIVKQIGMAAGKDTKVLPVNIRDYAGNMIMDVSNAIGEMYDLV